MEPKSEANSTQSPPKTDLSISDPDDSREANGEPSLSLERTEEPPRSSERVEEFLESSVPFFIKDNQPTPLMDHSPHERTTFLQSYDDEKPDDVISSHSHVLFSADEERHFSSEKNPDNYLLSSHDEIKGEDPVQFSIKLETDATPKIPECKATLLFCFFEQFLISLSQ